MASKGRTRIIDHVAPGSEADPNFLKMKRELEDAQQGQGWLFGRGAFDRQDIMYLKEHKAATITQEQELDDHALSEFARLKSKASAELDAAIPQPGSGAGTVLLAVKQKKEIKPVAKLLPIKVASASKQAVASAAQTALLSPAAAAPTGGPQGKRAGLALEQDDKSSKHAKLEDQDSGGGLAGLLGYSDDSDEDE